LFFWEDVLYPALGELLIFPLFFPEKQCGAMLRRAKYKRKFGKKQMGMGGGKKRSTILNHRVFLKTFSVSHWQGFQNLEGLDIF